MAQCATTRTGLSASLCAAFSQDSLEGVEKALLPSSRVRYNSTFLRARFQHCTWTVTWKKVPVSFPFVDVVRNGANARRKLRSRKSGRTRFPVLEEGYGKEPLRQTGRVPPLSVSTPDCQGF